MLALSASENNHNHMFASWLVWSGFYGVFTDCFECAVKRGHFWGQLQSGTGNQEPGLSRKTGTSGYPKL